MIAENQERVNDSGLEPKNKPPREYIIKNAFVFLKRDGCL
jgi:hypothetical protein